MSDGSDSLQRCEEVSGTESAEPPSSYGLRRPRLLSTSPSALLKA
jgi:hypothetical protein